MPSKTPKFDRGSAIYFFVDGKNVFDTSEFLFKTNKHYLGFVILFLHGLELLLKSFIIFKTSQKPPEEHDIKKLYIKCKKLDSDNLLIDSAKLKKLLDFLSENFYIDTVTARYPDLQKTTTRFPYDSFAIIREFIIVPFENKIL